MAPQRLLHADWSAAQVIQGVRNEVSEQLGYLDILVLDRDHQNLIAIENKTFSQSTATSSPLPQRSDRGLPRLRKAPHLSFPCGVEANQERDWKHWQQLLLLHTRLHPKNPRDRVAEPNAEALLQIYATAIRRNIMPETNIDIQARRIYLEHREALDRIFANKPNWIEETKLILREAVAKYLFWKLDLEAAQIVRFRAADWDEFPSSQTGTAGAIPTRFSCSNSGRR